MTVRIGVIGLGGFAQNHLEAWRVLDGATVAAVCDRDPARVAAARARFGVAGGFTDAGAMLAAGGLDAVDIVTTAPSHAALAMMAARAGVDVICQKPLAETAEDARAMVAACAAAGVSLAVHENFRFQAPMRAIAGLVRAGAIGEPFRAVIDFRSRHDVYAAQPYLATDRRFILQDLGVHLIDLARCFMGDVRGGACGVACWTRRVNPAIAGEDVATLVLDHGGGRTSVITASYATYRDPDLFPQTLVSLEGPAGSIELLADGRLKLVRPGGTEWLAAAPQLWPWSAAPGQVVQDSVVAFQRHWLDCRRGGVPPETSGEDNLHTLALVHAAYADADRRAASPNPETGIITAP